MGEVTRVGWASGSTGTPRRGRPHPAVAHAWERRTLTGRPTSPAGCGPVAALTLAGRRHCARAGRGQARWGRAATSSGVAASAGVGGGRAPRGGREGVGAASVMRGVVGGRPPPTVASWPRFASPPPSGQFCTESSRPRLDVTPRREECGHRQSGQPGQRVPGLYVSACVDHARVRAVRPVKRHVSWVDILVREVRSLPPCFTGAVRADAAIRASCAGSGSKS